MNFYNDIDTDVCMRLEGLIRGGLIPDGIVDNRSIEDIHPDELMRYTQVHMFCGIAGWPLALQLAGIPSDYPIWTGSCPCQPFSSAGKGNGFADERHLWPAFFHLIRECRPSVVFGEQVASAAVGPWIDLVSNDLEAVDYAFGAVAFPACSVGAKHIRQRTYWAAIANTERDEQSWEEPCSGEVGRVGRIIEPFPWDEPWQSALSRFRAMGDGLPRSVGGTDAARNAIVPHQAAHFIMATLGEIQ